MTMTMASQRWRMVGWLVVLPLAVHAAKSEEATKCGLYLAPSSIPGAGLGIYAGDKTYEKGETVTFGDTVIPIVEFDWNNQGSDSDYPFLWEEYTWNGEVFPEMEEEGDDVGLINAASPGLGAAANCFLSLVNVEDTWIKVSRPVKGDSPGSGATSIYYGREFYSSKQIPPGGEIFVDYGSNYFESRSQTYGYIPLPKTYKYTDSLLKRFQMLRNIQMAKQERNKKALAAGSDMSDELWDDYWSVVTSFATTWKTSRVLNALPSNISQIAPVLSSGGSAKMHYNHSIRELSWLEEHGQCMDNIKVGNSTNPDAGRGASANRFIPKGGLVAPAPLIHIPDMDVLKIFLPKDTDEPGKVAPDRDGPATFQLILNYCFGHQHSTLVLCPYGLLTAFINHSADKPNTKIQWSKEMRHPQWRDQAIDEWADEYHTGLSLDFVALRDIKEDEEILIDYGSAWQSAWRKHVDEWVPRENYIPAFELNEMSDIKYRTPEDRDYKADGVTMWCRSWYVNRFVQKSQHDSECRILKKLGDDSYLVQLWDDANDDLAGTTTPSPGKIWWDVPSDAFVFGDLPYSRDQHQTNTFRYAMMMPDEMFPEVWKNREEKSD